MCGWQVEYVECGLCNSYRAQTGSAIGISRFHQSSCLGAVSASRMQGERPIGPYLANDLYHSEDMQSAQIHL